MDSPHSDLLRSLREAAHQGDWKRAGQLVDALSASPPPSELNALEEYLSELREALVAARASRSHITARLNRIRAAASFISGNKLPVRRHDFVDSPKS